LEATPQPGPLALATDEAILRAVVAGDAPPTLRLYPWVSPTLTLGRGQPTIDADTVALARDNVTLLRRPTGGTAVYHDATELTYTVVAHDDEPQMRGSIAESYAGVSAALLHALRSVGLENGAAASHPFNSVESGAARSPVCFVAPSAYEITVGGRKLVGSAQMRVRGGILQHGSVYLSGDITHICAYLSARPDPAHVHARALTLAEALGRVVAWDELARAVVAGFTAALNLDLQPGALSHHEVQAAETLLHEKYTNAAWTQRV
jgi:lipoate-protein ligase A